MLVTCEGSGSLAHIPDVQAAALAAGDNRVLRARLAG